MGDHYEKVDQKDPRGLAEIDRIIAKHGLQDDPDAIALRKQIDRLNRLETTLEKEDIRTGNLSLREVLDELSNSGLVESDNKGGYRISQKGKELIEQEGGEKRWKQTVLKVCGK